MWLPRSSDSLWSGRELETNVPRSEEHTSELQSRLHLVCRLLLEKKKKNLHLISLSCQSLKQTAMRRWQRASYPYRTQMTPLPPPSHTVLIHTRDLPTVCRTSRNS